MHSSLCAFLLVAHVLARIFRKLAMLAQIWPKSVQRQIATKKCIWCPDARFLLASTWKDCGL